MVRCLFFVKASLGLLSTVNVKEKFNVRANAISRNNFYPQALLNPKPIPAAAVELLVYQKPSTTSPQLFFTAGLAQSTQMVYKIGSTRYSSFCQKGCVTPFPG